MLAEVPMVVWVIAWAGLYLGFTMGGMLVPWMINSMSGISMAEDPSVLWKVVNTLLVWGLAIVLTTSTYITSKRILG